MDVEDDERDVIVIGDTPQPSQNRLVLDVTDDNDSDYNNTNDTDDDDNDDGNEIEEIDETSDDNAMVDEKAVVGPLGDARQQEKKKKTTKKEPEQPKRKKSTGSAPTDIFSIKGQSIYNTFYLRFAEAETNITSAINRLSDVIRPYRDIDSLYTDLYDRFVMTYDSGAKSNTGASARVLKLALDCPDLFLLCAFMFMSDWLAATRTNNRDWNEKRGPPPLNTSLIQHLVDVRRKQGGPQGTPPYDAIRAALESLSRYMLHEHALAYRRGHAKKEQIPSKADSLDRLYKRLRAVRGKKGKPPKPGVTPLASLLALATVNIELEPQVVLSLERLVAENRGIAYYKSEPWLYKPVFSMRDIYSTLLQHYAPFESLVERYVLSAEATNRVVSLGDMDALFYAVTAPLYHEKGSSRSFVFRMARDLLFLLREQHRQQGNIVQYVRLLDTLARQPVDGSLGPERNKALVTQVVEGPQFRALGKNALRFDTPVHILLSTYERFKSPLERHYRFDGPLVKSTVDSLCESMWRQQRDFTDEYAALGDPLPLFDKDTLTLCIKHRMGWFHRLITQQTYLLDAVREILYPRLVDALWTLLLQQIRTALDMQNGDSRCCSPRDIRILRSVLLETDTTRLWYIDKPSDKLPGIHRHKRLRLPWLDRRLFDAQFVEISEASGAGEDRIRLPDPDQTQQSVEYTEAELAGYVKCVVRLQLGHLRRQMHFMYNAFFHDVRVTGGPNATRSQNPVYHCLQQVVQQHVQRGPLAPFAADLYETLGCYCTLEFQNAMGVDTRAYDADYFYMKLCRPASLHADPTVSSRAVCDDMRLISLLENNEQLFAFNPRQFKRDLSGLNITGLRRTGVQWLCDEIKRQLAIGPGLFTQSQLYAMIKTYEKRTSTREQMASTTVLTEFIGHAEMMYLPEVYTQLLYYEDEQQRERPRTLGELKTALGLPGGNQAIRPVAASTALNPFLQSNVPMNILMVLRVPDPIDTRPRYYILNDTGQKDDIPLDALDVQDNLFLIAVPQDAAHIDVFVSIVASPPKQRTAIQQQSNRVVDTYAVVELRDKEATYTARLFTLDFSDWQLSLSPITASDVLARCVTSDDPRDYTTLVSSGEYRVTDFVQSRMEDKRLILITLTPTQGDRSWNAHEMTVSQYCGVCYAVEDYLLRQAPLVITAENRVNDATLANTGVQQQQATTKKGRRSRKNKRGVLLVPTDAMVQRQIEEAEARQNPQTEQERQKYQLQSLYMARKKAVFATSPLASYPDLGASVATEFFMRARKMIDDGDVPQQKDYYTAAQIKAIVDINQHGNTINFDLLTPYLTQLAANNQPQLFTASEQSDIDTVRQTMLLNGESEAALQALTLETVQRRAKEERYGEEYEVLTLNAGTEQALASSGDPMEITILSSDSEYTAVRKRYRQVWLEASSKDTRARLIDTLDKYVALRRKAQELRQIAIHTNDNQDAPDMDMDEEEEDEEEEEDARALAAMVAVASVGGVPEYTPTRNQVGASADQSHLFYPPERGRDDGNGVRWSPTVDPFNGTVYAFDNSGDLVDPWAERNAFGFITESPLRDFDGNPIFGDNTDDDAARFY